MEPGHLKDSKVARIVRGPRLVVTFAISSLVAFLAIGTILTILAIRHTETRELQRVQKHAAFVTDWLVRRQVSERSLAEPLTIERFNRLHRSTTARLLEFPVLRLKIWSNDGTLVYSDERRLIGRKSEGERGLDRALRGETVSYVSNEADETEESPYEEEIAGKLLETYVPLYLSGDDLGEPSGAVELYQDYASVQSEIDQLLSALIPTLVIGLAALYLLQLPLARRIGKVLSNKNAQLEEQAARLERHLETERETVVKLEELNRLKSEFVDVASHELRNPLAAVAGAVKTLRRSGDADPVIREQVFDIAYRQIDRLTEMSDRLLLSERLENGRFPLSLSRFSLGDLANEVITGVESQARRVTIDVSDKLPVLYSDRRAVEEILTNLVENALKFSPDGSPCEIRAWAHEGSVSFSVQDHGSGIPKGSLERIFERFYRVSNGSVPGVGLGLSLVKEFVDQLHGSIAVASRLGRGSEFTVTLPVRHPMILDAEGAGATPER